MTLHRETMEAYLAREAVSASFCHDLTSECPRYAYLRSPFCPEEERVAHSATDAMDFGTIAHCALLEEHLLEERILLVSEANWRTKSAQAVREQAAGEGKIAMLTRDYQRVRELRWSLESDPVAGPLVFSKGESELSYTWEWDGVPCKARIDRLTECEEGKCLVHLKTSRSANPLAFANVGAGLGYALAMAWYLDGWYEQSPEAAFDSYRMVVIGSNPPHLTTVCYYDPIDLEIGRRRYKKALVEFRRARESGVWRGYAVGNGPVMLREPAWYRRAVSDEEGMDHG